MSILDIIAIVLFVTVTGFMIYCAVVFTRIINGIFHVHKVVMREPIKQIFGVDILDEGKRKNENIG